MEEKLNRLKVVIAGDEYTIKGDAADLTISEISKYVDNKLKEVGSGSTSGERYKLAVLTAINITHELFEAKNELSKFTGKLDEFKFKTKEITEKLASVG